MDVNIKEKITGVKPEDGLEEYKTLITNMKESMLAGDISVEETKEVKKSILKSLAYFIRGTTLNELKTSDKELEDICDDILKGDNFNFEDFVIDLDVSRESRLSITAMYHLISSHVINSESKFDFEVLFSIIDNDYSFNLIYGYDEWCTSTPDKILLSELLDEKLKTAESVESVKEVLLKYNILCFLDTSEEILKIV